MQPVGLTSIPSSSSQLARFRHFFRMKVKFMNLFPMTIKARRFALPIVCLVLALMGAAQVKAQDVSTYLTDKIYQGSGTINLLKDVSAATLDQYLKASSELLLGIDVNENASGNETSTSMGIAIKSMTLYLKTTTGDFAFSNVFTNTTATLTTAGGGTGTYYTAFGQAGSSNLTGSTGFNMAALDDVIQLKDISFTGTILSANLAVSFVSTDPKGGANNTFFDFSGGFEDFALLSRADAVTLEQAAIGVAGSPSTITYATAPLSETLLAPTTTTTNPSSGGGAPAAPGAPLPSIWLFMAAAILMLLKVRTRRMEMA